MTNNLQTHILFEKTEFGDPFRCSECRWEKTAACPKDYNFFGDKTVARTYFERGNYACHRFIMTASASATRQKRLMEKLSQNLDIDSK